MIRINKYNIADTTPSAEDELITEQIFPDTPFIKELKPHYQEVIQLRYFQN
jgi:RNA polymerase sigma-70 factor (ECF subfamily)